MDTASSNVQVDPVAIRTWCDVVFGYLDCHVAIRLISEKGTPEQQPQSRFFSLDKVAGELIQLAPQAILQHRAVFAVPGTVEAAGRAQAADIRQTGVILADLDDGDVDAIRDHLVKYIGVPSLEVASGGTTAAGLAKRHLFWRLTEAATGTDLTFVSELRGLLARKIGGDPSFGSIHQPIRVAGTIHGKHGLHSNVRILTHSDREVDLAEIAEAVHAMPEVTAMGRAFEIDTGNPSRASARDLMTTIIHEGSVDEKTRFGALSMNIGHWLRTVRLGRCVLDDAWHAVREYNAAMIRPPWEEAKLLRSFRGILSKDIEANGPMPEPRTVVPAANEDGPAAPELSDDHLAARFVSDNGRNWKYVPVWGDWYHWTGTHWAQDEVGAAFHTIRLSCRAVAGNLDKPAEARRITSAKTIQAVQRIVASDPAIAMSPEKFDRDPMLLNTPAGVIDLESGSVQAHDRALLMTQICRASLRSGCPRWLAFLDQITGGENALKSHLARVAGYCLTGSTREQAFFFLHGSGANGKSVFLQTIAHVLGNYAATAAADTFSGRGPARHLTELAGLRAARVVLVSETEAGEPWAEARIKNVTGGEVIRANFMYRDHFEFQPRFKLLVAGNHRPVICEAGEAMRRRLHLIPFSVTIPAGERDLNLGTALQEEADGILGWMIDGCADWMERGLDPPASLLDAAEDYFVTEDQLGHWIDERCTLGPTRRATAAALFASWSDWARANGHMPGSTRLLGENLRARGFASGKVERSRGWLGIGLHPISIVGSES